MKLLRLYIIKIGLIGFICSGLLITALQPLQASQSSQNFENWLQDRVENVTADDTKQQAVVVNKSFTDSFVEKALLLSKQTNNDFDWLTLAESLSTNIYQLLLIEWTQFQAGNKMVAVPPAKTIKPFISHQYKPGFSAENISFASPLNHKAFLPASIFQKVESSANHYTIEPLIGGIAIGAP